MTQLGNFWEGMIMVGVGAVMTIAGKHFGVDFSSTPAFLMGLGVGHLKALDGAATALATKLAPKQ